MAEKVYGLNVGDKAPDFELPKEDNEPVRLSSFIGKKPVILAFYPSDFGMMCTVEIKGLKEYYPQLKDICTLLPISTNTTYSHGNWIVALDLPFSLLSDRDGKVSRMYDVMPDPNDIAYGYLEGGRSYRCVFILDLKGVIRYKWAPEDPSLEPDYDELVRVCTELMKER